MSGADAGRKGNGRKEACARLPDFQLCCFDGEVTPSDFGHDIQCRRVDFGFLGQSRYHLILTCGGCGKFHLVRYVEFEQLLELQFVVVECRAGHDDLIFVAHVLAFDLGEVDLADRPRPPHLAGPVTLGA